MGTIVTGLVDLLAHQAWMVAAVVGTVLMFTLALSSWRRLRQRIPYETWYGIHLYVYLAMALGFLHQLTLGVDFVDADAAAEVEVEAFKRGLLVLTCGDRGVRMSPPLVVNAEEIKTAVRIFAEAAAAVAARR